MKVQSKVVFNDSAAVVEVTDALLVRLITLDMHYGAYKLVNGDWSVLIYKSLMDSDPVDTYTCNGDLFDMEACSSACHACKHSIPNAVYTMDNRVAGLLADAMGDMSKTTSRKDRYDVFYTYTKELNTMDEEINVQVDKQYHTSSAWAAWHEYHCAIHQVWTLLWDMYRGVVQHNRA
jgi:hypothetical protein